MKYAKLIAILLIVLLTGFFLIGSEKGVEKNKDKNHIKVKIQCNKVEDIDLDFLDDLELNLKGLDKKIEKIVEASLEDLNISIDLEGLESLESLDCLKDLEVKVKNIADVECFRILEDMESFFEDFEWDFDWDWDCKIYKKNKSKSNSKNKEDI